MKMKAVMGAALLFVAIAGRMPAEVRSWAVPADYAGEFSAYSIDIGTYADGHAFLSPGHRYEYAADPAYGVFWTNNPVAVTALPHPLTENGFFPAVAALNGRIFIIGGYRALIGPVAEVWRTEVDAAGNMGDWVRAAYDFAQSSPSAQRTGIVNHRAIGVGDRIFVVGGSPNIETAPGVFTLQNTSREVYSAQVQVNGEIAPWVREPSLIKTASSFGLVFTAGALYAIGGDYCANPTCTQTYPYQWVQKAEILPSGRLSAWTSVRGAPQGVPPPDKGCECANVAGCASDDLACCRQANQNMGWLDVGSFSVARTIGFMGGRFNRSVDPVCSGFKDLYYAYLDDCNQLSPWNGVADGRGRADSCPQAYNGTFISAGGYFNGAASPAIVHNPAGGNPGFIRDPAFGSDSTELMPNSPGLDVAVLGSGHELPASAYPAPVAMAGNRLFLLGFMDGTIPSPNVYRATLAQAAGYTDSAYYLSRPYDLGGNMRLTNVSWILEKHGAGTQSNPDDWGMVRYRIAPEGGEWTCWSPRIPEAGNMPLTVGTHRYANRDQAGNAVPRSSRLWMPLLDEDFRYIQFEVSLYKGSATANLPEFHDFSIEYEPAPAKYVQAVAVEAYPVPTGDSLNLGFMVVPEGAEVTAEIFNVAGEKVAGESWVFTKGGSRKQEISTRDFADGVYVVLVKARGMHGGPGLVHGDKKTGSARVKIVVRRKK